MRTEDVDARWGKRRKWVWVTRPMYVFEEDGRERGGLEPVGEVLPEHCSDEQGTWTCNPDTRRGDLAVFYRSGAKNDPGCLPRHGPKDLYYIARVTSDAFLISDDPLVAEIGEHHYCRFVVVGRFQPPIGLQTMRANSVLKEWGALKASFVQAAMPLPQSVWDELVRLDAAGSAGGDDTGTRPPLPTAAQIRRVEAKLEDWLEHRPDVLERLVGFPVTVQARQLFCGRGQDDDHSGTIDLLLRRKSRKSELVVVELKVTEIKRDAIAQTLGYIGWMRSLPRVRTVSGIVIGLGLHPQVPYVLATVPNTVTLRHWKDIELPAELRAELDELHLLRPPA